MSVTLRRYFRGATLATMVTPLNGERRTYHLDHQGTVQCLTNAQGVVTDRFACDAWGNEFKRTGTSINRQWYIGNLGYYRQVDQALDYVRARWLDLGLGQWLTSDPLSSTLQSHLHFPENYGRSNSGKYGRTPSGGQTQFGCDRRGSQTVGENARSYRASYAYDAVGHPTVQDAALGRRISRGRRRRCRRLLPSEPCWRVSPHTVQAS